MGKCRKEDETAEINANLSSIALRGVSKKTSSPPTAGMIAFNKKLF